MQHYARRLWGAPVTLTTKIADGSGILLSEGAAGIDTDGRVDMQWGRDGSDFSHNQIRARAEGRFGVEVYRPTGVVGIDLTA